MALSRAAFDFLSLSEVNQDLDQVGEGHVLDALVFDEGEDVIFDLLGNGDLKQPVEVAEVGEGVEGVSLFLEIEVLVGVESFELGFELLDLVLELRDLVFEEVFVLVREGSVEQLVVEGDLEVPGVDLQHFLVLENVFDISQVGAGFDGGVALEEDVLGVGEGSLSDLFEIMKHYYL